MKPLTKEEIAAKFFPQGRYRYSEEYQADKLACVNAITEYSAQQDAKIAQLEIELATAKSELEVQLQEDGPSQAAVLQRVRQVLAGQQIHDDGDHEPYCGGCGMPQSHACEPNCWLAGLLEEIGGKDVSDIDHEMGAKYLRTMGYDNLADAYEQLADLRAKLSEAQATIETLRKENDKHKLLWQEAEKRLYGADMWAKAAELACDEALEEVEKLKKSWRCFGCDFVTSDPKAAEAHFGDGDEASEFVPVCKWWAESDDDERKRGYQDLIIELNGARDREAEALAWGEKLADAAEMLWVVLANVSVGDWTKQSQEWQEAAARWRDNYHAALSTPPPTALAQLRAEAGAQALRDAADAMAKGVDCPEYRGNESCHKRDAEWLRDRAAALSPVQEETKP